MDKFFNTIKKGLVAMLFVVVGFSMTYVPQLPSSNVPEAEAMSCAGPCATLLEQRIQSGLQAAGNVSASVTAAVTGNLWFKENVLDGIGWAIAKRIVSGMIRSLINWVNSGFQGSPSFVSDLKGFLLNIADEEIGRFIQNNLGDVGSFICSPFRLDVQISVAMQYAQGRSGQTAPTCTLSGIVGNIRGFIEGIDPGGGLSDWMTITATPQTYTPYGSILNAQVEARARLINAQGQVLKEVDWGDGFLSQKICEAVEGGSTGSSCSISKPGRVIADQLNKALGAGQDALIEADEINELIAALLGQLANRALTGVAGLLGLSGGTGFSYSGYDGSYLDELLDESDEILEDAGQGSAQETITEQLALQIDYYDLLTSYQPVFIDFANNVTNPIEEREVALSEAADIADSLETVEADIIRLTDMALEYETATSGPQIAMLVELTNMDTLNENSVAAIEAEWFELTNSLDISNPAIISTVSLFDLLTLIDPTRTIDTFDQEWIDLADTLNLEATAALP